MTFARRSALRAALNRRIKLEGEFLTSVDSIAVKASQVTVLKAVKAKTETDYAAGTILELKSLGTVTAHDKAITVKYPRDLYSYGIVSGPTILDQTDGQTYLSCIVTLLKDTPQDAFLGLTFKLYVEGE